MLFHAPFCGAIFWGLQKMALFVRKNVPVVRDFCVGGGRRGTVIQRTSDMGKLRKSDMDVTWTFE